MKEAQNADIRDLSDADILKHIMQMNPFKFEQFVGDLLNTMDFKTRVTKPTGDGGVDIEAEHETPTGASIEYVVQVKRHTNIISPKELQALVGAMQGSKADRCIFVTTSSFSAKSIEYAELMKTIELVDGKKLIELIREHGVMPETLAKIGESRISIPVCSADEGMRLGKEAYNRGDYEEALKYFDRVINLEPENDEAWVWKGKSELNKVRFSGFPSKELLKRLSTKQYREKFLEWITTSWGGADKYGINAFRKAVEITPEGCPHVNPEYAIDLAFEKAVEINPDNIEAWSYVNPEKAIQLCEEILKSNPNDEQVWLNMGKAYQWKGWRDFNGEELERNAEKCFNKVVEINPKNEEALFYIGMLSIPTHVMGTYSKTHYSGGTSYTMPESFFLDITSLPEYTAKSTPPTSLRDFGKDLIIISANEGEQSYWSALFKFLEHFRTAVNYFDRCLEINPDNHHYIELREGITREIKALENLELNSELKKKEEQERRISQYVVGIILTAIIWGIPAIIFAYNDVLFGGLFCFGTFILLPITLFLWAYIMAHKPR